jgi:hypothetical protein
MARDISDWLEGLGLDKYSALFADNDIGFDILPDLSQELLKELGVSSFGDRVRLLKAVETLDTNAIRWFQRLRYWPRAVPSKLNVAI